MEYLKATPEHDDILITHYLAIWDSYGTHFCLDPQLKIRRFIEEGRDSRELATFIAMDGATPQRPSRARFIFPPIRTFFGKMCASTAISGASS